MYGFRDMEKINVVWFKRDLRLKDHAPLKHALDEGLPVLLVYFVEPSLVRASQSNIRHWKFIYESLTDLNQSLKLVGSKIYLFHEEVIPAFKHIQQHYQLNKLFSHQETGIAITYQRDREVKRFCQGNKVIWQEWRQNGAQRGRKNRKGWSAQWETFMNQPLEDPVWEKRNLLNPDFPEFSGRQTSLDWMKHSPATMQEGGESRAHQYLTSFLEGRVKNYSRFISKPEASRRSCSRLSPYLAWGNLSVRQVFQAAESLRKAGKYTGPIRNFQSRLRWHCHFIQKFEMEERMEFEPINRGFLDYGYEKNPERLEAWKMGKTGVPLVDACMRCLVQTGYVNFRMRAMLVSFLTHHLNLDWRAGADHLAQLFLDFEPGIHYPQLQMQAGMTGINQVRIYNPIKQSGDHDPEGVFIKKWVPELASLPFPYFHEPWKTPPIEGQMAGLTLGDTYPFPIVDPEKAARLAREKIWKAQSLPEVKKEAKRILARHTLSVRWR